MNVVESMKAYYAQRAEYYERVYAIPERQVDLRAMEAWTRGVFAGRRVLEIACGTCWWTPHAAALADSWLATDINPETMSVAAIKALPACVEHALVDAYSLDGLDDSVFDAAFAGCWWSHIPLQDLPGWLHRLHARLEPGARVVFLDNSFVQTSSTPISHADAVGNTYQQRVLDDGSLHTVLKNFPSKAEAFAAVSPWALDPEWIQYEHYWILSYRLKPY
jgi:ubiquinone/menaquinone biosynthesis C-methylase UbiE